MSDVVLLIGAAEFRLDARAAELLLEWIRDLAPDDAMGVAILELADEIEASEGEPIELGHTAIEGLSAYVLRDYLVRGDEALTALLCAVRRYCGDPV